MNHPDTSIRADPSLAMQEFILVVDDNQITTKLMIRMLLGRGYHVEQALNGETALQIVRTRSPDLILLDILMPGIDGYEVCKTLKADPQTQTIPIIFISSVEQITDKVKAFSVGAADFMQKPFQMPEVLARVENQLQRVRLDRTLKQQQEQLLLQNQRLQREMDDRFRVELALKRQSHTLSRFSNTLIHLHRLSLTDFQSLEELFQEYLQTGCTLLGFSTGMIGRLEEAVYSIQAFYPDSKDWKLGCPFEVKGTFYEQVLREKRTIAFPHPEPGTVPNLPDSIQSIGTYLGTPIFVDHDLYGVLCFFDTQARNEGFESHEWEVIELMAQSIGKFIKLQEAQAKRQQVERELQQAKETAEAANRTKGEFLANMSHELRTPLNVILGFTQIIAREESLTPAIRDSLATITRSGEHLLLLINDVLEMSKIEAGKVVLNPVCFDLHELLSSLEEMLWLKAQAKGIDLQLVWDPTVPHAIQTDEGKLRQILLNLLSNAIKFTPQGQVTLRVTGNGGSGKPDNLEGLVKLAFEVEDTGIGIEVEELERVFEPFVQSQHRNHLIEGTGLGLPISRCFAQLMGGDIQIQSLVGEGTIVRFEVEVALAPPQAVPSPGFSRQVIGIAPNQPTYRILVVEDHLESRNLLQNLLQGLGFEVQTAHNGQEAIAQWQNWHPHLIWMDIRLPEMDGCEATQRIRAMERIKASTRPPTKILALTANAFEEERTKVLAAGCNDFVRKPVLEEMLLSKMSKHLGVQFIYREVARSCPSPAIFLEEAPLSVHEVKSCLSSIMPKDWIQAFHQAAHLGSDERLLHLIGQIPLAHSRLIQTLTSLVRNFCFDQLLDVSQSPVQ